MHSSALFFLFHQPVIFLFFFFFFQAEDGIRDVAVTGVQTCALPISSSARVQLPVPNLPRALEGLRILHVTDFHLHRFWKEPYDELLRRIAADEPDLLLSGGDYVEDKRDHRPALPMALRMVRGFRAKLGVFGILGNHDLHRMEPHLRRTPMDLIDGARREIPFGDDGTVIEIIGLPGVDRDELTEDFLYSFP